MSVSAPVRLCRIAQCQRSGTMLLSSICEYPGDVGDATRGESLMPCFTPIEVITSGKHCPFCCSCSRFAAVESAVPSSQLEVG